MTGPGHGIRRSSSWASLNSAPPQLVSRDISRGYYPNSRNVTSEITKSLLVNNRFPRHTFPLRKIVRVIDQLKLKYIEQHEQQQRLTNKENGILPVNKRPQSAEVMQARPRRDPSPTPPMRVLHASKENIAPEKVTTYRSSSSASNRRPVRVQLTLDEVREKKNSEPDKSYARMTEALRTKKTNTEQYVENLTVVKKPKPPPIENQTIPTETMIKWMHSNGVSFPHLNQPSAIDIVNSMCNGVKLAELVERLENVTLKGIDKTSTKHAAVHNNINKALEPLRTRKNMNARYLWTMDDIIAGKPQITWGLLEDIFHEYVKFKRKERTSSASKKILRPSQNPTPVSPPKKQTITQRQQPTREEYHQPPEKPIQKSHPVGTKDMEAEARAWLHKINFDVLLSHRTHDHNDILRDVLRNGVFICELVTTLQQKPNLMRNVTSPPARVEDARANIEFALSLLKGGHSIPAMYLYENIAEKILCGEREAIWGLIYHIMRCYPNAVSNPDQHYSKANTLYPPEQMRLLEQSLLFWLRTLGMLPASDGMSPHQALAYVETGVRNGTLLCDLVSFVVGERIIGVSRAPKVAATCLANINRALEQLRKRKGMTSEFLWRDQEILDGDKNIMLGLLEDIHRFYDKVPARSSASSRNVPYLGKIPLPHKTGRMVDPSEIFGSPGRSNHTQLLRSSHLGNIPMPMAPPTELKPSIPTPSKYANVELRPYPEPFFPSSHLANVLLPEPYVVNASVSALMHGASRPSTYGSTNRFMDSSTFRQPLYLQDEYESQPSEGFLLAKWLESMGIKLSTPFALEQPTIPEFSDGVLLCNIVKALEHKEIPGVTYKPKKMASYLHNVRKALEVLRKKKNMPATHLYSEQEIQKGNGAVICELLEQMRRAYHNK